MLELSRRLGLVLVAAALGGCFPDYSVAEDGNGSSENNEITVGQFRAWWEGSRTLPLDGASLDPGGRYESQMIWHKAWNSNATEAHFYVNGVDAEKCNVGPAPAAALKSTWALVVNEGAPDDLPMTCVSWAQAAAFCAAENMRLPTASEWLTIRSRAQEGFPWGSSPPSSCAQATVAIEGGPAGCGFPVSVYEETEDVIDGHRNMIGSVFEWTWDTIWPPPDAPPDLNSTGPNSPDLVVERYRAGGAFVSHPESGAVAGELDPAHGATQVYNDLGFRCFPIGLWLE